MKSAKEIVTENLIKLRKQANLTQIELSRKISYSDKAISRWEKGEVVPNIEILEELSRIYDVPISYFFTEHNLEEAKKFNDRQKNLYAATLLSLVLIVWTISIIVFLILRKYGYRKDYMSFIWAVPATIFVAWRALKVWFKDKFFLIMSSLTFWSIVVASYIQLFEYNLWYIFFINIPIQITIILNAVLKKLKETKPKKK